MGLERPLFLALILPIAVLFWFLARRGDKDFFIHPLSSHLQSNRLVSRIPLTLLLLIGTTMVLASSRPYWKATKTLQKERSRLIGIVTDVSASMTGEPLEAARYATQQLITHLKNDRINVLFFGDETSPTAFGISDLNLSNSAIRRIVTNVGPIATNVDKALFAEFMEIAIEENLFTSKQLKQIEKIIKVGDKNNHSSMREYDVEAFSSIPVSLQAYLANSGLNKSETEQSRLVILVSDCKFAYSHLHIGAILDLYKRFGVQLEVICEGKYQLNGKNGWDEIFARGVVQTGGQIHRIGKITDGRASEQILTDVMMRAAKVKQREFETGTVVRKRYIYKYLFSTALILIGILAASRIYSKTSVNP